jgi:8-amino-7-oxononanoate synthase
MLDFTSSLYLGLRHSSGDLLPWAQLTTGKPALLEEPPAAQLAAARLARLTGLETGVMARSTLHAFWDLMPVLVRILGTVAIFIDAGTYPLAKWAVERAMLHGVPGHQFRHHNASDLKESVVTHAGLARRPIVVADGLCPGCGGLLPAAEYFEIAQKFGGVLVLDDTQALGVVGPSGGGSVPQAGICDPASIVVSSLAKGFGAPLAFVGGSMHVVARYQQEGETRAHSSPPSMADLHAALRALDLNETEGRQRRSLVRQLVVRFRRGLGGLGLASSGGLFPLQTLRPLADVTAPELHRGLTANGIRTILHRPICATRPRLSFLFTADHRLSDVDAALAALAVVARAARSA